MTIFQFLLNKKLKIYHSLDMIEKGEKLGQPVKIERGIRNVHYTIFEARIVVHYSQNILNL